MHKFPNFQIASTSTRFLKVGKFMHQTNAGTCIGENVKIAQRDPEFENDNEGDGVEHLESNHCPPLAVNVANNNYHIRHNENVLEGHARSPPPSSLAPYDSNCPKQLRILNCCEQVNLQTL